MLYFSNTVKNWECHYQCYWVLGWSIPTLLSKFLGKLEEFAKKHILLRICLEETSIVLVLIDVFSWFNLVSFIIRVMQIDIMEIEGMVQQPNCRAILPYNQSLPLVRLFSDNYIPLISNCFLQNLFHRIQL